jgi:predicted enzyme involved in methoxymalonyl-ACP biosynthesis
VLREILRHAAAAGVHRLVGVYRPTERNKLVLDHYSKLGFAKREEDANGTTRWERLVDGNMPESAPMTIVSSGFPQGEEKSAT